MKTLIFLICLQFITAYSPKRELHLTIKILPEFFHEFRGRIMTLQIEVNENVYDTSFVISEKHLFSFDKINKPYAFIKIYGLVKSKDSGQRFYWTGDRISFTENKNVNHEITFPVDCDVNKYFGGKICPKCKTKDKVIPIRSGLLSPDIPGKVGIDYELGGCVRTPCDPGWFCKRDTLRF